MALSPLPDKNALQPRYRRLLGVGALLDESVRLFRERWRSFAVVSAVALLPFGILSVGVSVGLAAVGTAIASQPVRVYSLSALATPQVVYGTLGVFVLLGLVGLIDSLLWTAALTRTTDAYLHAEQPSVRGVYGLAVRRLLALVGGSLLLMLAAAILTLAATLLFVVTGFGLLGSIVALVGLLAWWRKPDVRKPWLKWLIVLAAPFGLPTYLLVRWSMFVPSVVVEGHGPIGALRRSSELVRGEWFRAASVLGVASLIVLVLASAPAYLVSIPLGVIDVARGNYGADLVGLALRNGVSIVCQVLFASIGTIAYTLLFIDLRNRREGTDLAERLQQIEAPSLRS